MLNAGSYLSLTRIQVPVLKRAWANVIIEKSFFNSIPYQAFAWYHINLQDTCKYIINSSSITHFRTPWGGELHFTQF